MKDSQSAEPSRRGAVEPSRRGSAVQPFRAMELLKDVDRLRAAGRDTYLLCLGQPSTPAPKPVITAATRALASDNLGYTATNGLPAAREAIAAYYLSTYHVIVDPARILITTGSSAAFTALFLAAFDAADTVLVTNPGYPAYRETLAALDLTVVELPCRADTDWQPTVPQLEEWVARTGVTPRGLVVASPANPTGTVIPANRLRELVAWCEEHAVLLISDEIYHGIIYGDEPVSTAIEFSQDVVSVGSFSKYFSMTGWRLGWAIVPEQLVRPVDLLLGNLNLSAPTLSQLAAPAAFTPEALAELDDHVARYATNRNTVLAQLSELDVPAIAPADGAFYAWVDVSAYLAPADAAGAEASATAPQADAAGAEASAHPGPRTSEELCREILEHTGVAVTPGADFDTEVGDRFIRISYAGATEDVETGMRLLTEYLRAQRAAR